MNINKGLSTEKTEASYAKRVLVGMFDAAVAIFVITCFLIYKWPSPVYELLLTFNATLAVLVFFIIYRLIGIVIFNGTLGMYIFRAVLLNGEQQPLSILEKILASVFILYRGVNYYNR